MPSPTVKADKDRPNTIPVKPLLAIDTSTRTVGLAVYDGVQVLSEATWATHDYHTVELAPAVAEALKKCGLSAAELGALAVAAGPGSFTGLRIGMALAKGMTLVQHMPLIGIPTLDILAASQPVIDLPLAAVLRAGRGRLAVGWYQCGKGGQRPPEHPAGKEHRVQNERWQASKPVEVLTPKELADAIRTPTLVCGELTADERQLLEHKENIFLASPAQSLRRPSFLAQLAWERWQSGASYAGDSYDPAALAPIYLHYNDPIPGQ